ncbi:hypothetical protein AYO40_01455 [Planctomycetaceae bacterium SCGC AG-212-D15]|nr:hypothetical protein AYO40_01455 [Planctomycetaceae bacterium SCGC AG-212-D15]
MMGEPDSHDPRVHRLVARVNLLRLILIFACHLLLWMPLVGLRIWANRLENVYREFDMTLPALTEWLISGGFVPLFGVMGLCLLFDVPALFSLPRGTAARWVWLAVMVLAPLVVSVIAGYFLTMPLFHMIEDLAR